MKKYLLLLFLLQLCAVVYAQKTVDVYLLGGQSNATGQGYMANLDESLKISKQVWIYHSGTSHLEGLNKAYTWSELAQASESVDRFGPELGLGAQLKMQNPDHQIAIIKHAHSGTNLYQDWNPGKEISDTANYGIQFKEFVYTVNKGLDELKTKGYKVVLKAMFWQQGEGDAERLENAIHYEQNLTHFINRIRTQFKSPDLPFVYGYVLPPPNDYEGRNAVRKAQKDISINGELKNVYLVETDDLSRRAQDRNTSYPKDYLHFSTQGTWDLGVRMAKTLNK